MAYCFYGKRDNFHYMAYSWKNEDSGIIGFALLERKRVTGDGRNVFLSPIPLMLYPKSVTSVTQPFFTLIIKRKGVTASGCFCCHPRITEASSVTSGYWQRIFLTPCLRSASSHSVFRSDGKLYGDSTVTDIFKGMREVSFTRFLLIFNLFGRRVTEVTAKMHNFTERYFRGIMAFCLLPLFFC